MLLGLATGAPAPKTYIEDVFSTYLYTGNASARSITNGIDCSSKKALTWIKERSAVAGSYQHFLFDTVRGAGNYLRTTQTAGQSTDSGMLSAFTSSGFSLGTTAETNVNNGTFVSWTFREAAKFFDVVTYTGNGATGRQISHNLGTTPGFIIIKKTSATGAWPTWHRSYAADNIQFLDTTDASIPGQADYFGTHTSSYFVVDSGTYVNANGASYVAYLFAHDTSADGLIQCGSFTTDGSGNATVSLGWEPQYLMLKASSATDNWRIEDTIRGLSLTGYSTLLANLSNAESSSSNTSKTLTATGFSLTSQSASTTYIYMAIRRGPMKPPTSGTQVYNAIARTGTGAAATVTGVGFPPDTIITSDRPMATSGQMQFADRIRGITNQLIPSSTGAEGATAALFTSFDMDGFSVSTNVRTNGSGGSYINWCLRRYPGVFDQVCYTGTGSTQNITHNLTVAPEMIIVKARGSAGYDWPVYHAALGNTKNLYLDLTGVATTNALEWNSTSPTSAVFTVRDTEVNNSGTTFTSYLFATLAGISKVGNYTGNGGGPGSGGSQTINCGFAAGARFVMIKCTSDAGDWFVFDTARNLVAGNDARLSINTTAAEVTTDDCIDPTASGFIVNQMSGTDLNYTGRTYIYLALA